ncbi:hypothetical protein TNIN_444161 [Trichonephila inaurata madagascariensis]|uniref:Uncharacterized protein n=1 Tax=Trichonephila inaurata madagascariensis TaxID=2747483 RepID=A0A8X6XTC3_9ARAC|nr:hypothetical protein TNIN_444161 [Trichonephila inaurata madagascariensis]
MNTPSTSHNGNNQFYPTGSVGDHSKKKEPVLPNFDVVLTKYDLEPPKIESQSICAKHFQYDGVFRAMNCHPVSAELVDDEESRDSIFEELELPPKSVATKKEESTSAEETKATKLFFNGIYLGTFQLTNAQRASRLIRPTLPPVNSISLSQIDTDPLTVEYRSTSTCKGSKTPCAQSCSQNGSSENCPVDEFRSFSEMSCSSEQENFSNYHLIFPPLRTSLSEVHLLQSQNKWIRVCRYLQRARQFLSFKLGCRK